MKPPSSTIETIKYMQVKVLTRGNLGRMQVNGINKWAPWVGFFRLNLNHSRLNRDSNVKYGVLLFCKKPSSTHFPHIYPELKREINICKFPTVVYVFLRLVA
jgi:hypothetical protein